DLGFDFSSDDHEQDAAFEQPSLEETELVHNVELDLATSEEPMPVDEMQDELLPDENLTIVERINTFKSDDIVLHRLLVAKELPSALVELGIEEALDKVIPIMDKLASDPDDTNAPTQFSTHDENTPQEHSFAHLFINVLLDPNSGVASLGQQAIITAITELYETCSRETSRQVVDSEIFKGVIEGLMEIVNGKVKPPRLEEEQQQQQYHRVSIDETNNDERRRSTPGFETSLHHVVPSDDEIDQGEVTLAKITCISLIASTAGILGTERCTNSCVSIIEQLASDQVFYVRKEAATALGSLALVVETKVAEERLLPLYRDFMEDQVWHVRRSSVMSLPHLCGILTDASRADIAVLSVEAFKNDTSRNVRNTMAEIVGDLISRFLPPHWEQTGQPGQIPEPILDYFLSLGNSTHHGNQMLKLETDRSFICAYNFPVVVLTAGVEYWNTHLRDTYLNLTKDYQIKVRCTFAHSLHEIAKIIGPERTERDLVQIFALYLMDLDDVKQGVLEHLADFLGTLAISSRNEYIPILAEVWDGVTTNWRLRNILAAQLRDIAMLFDASRVVEHVLPLVVRACHDEFAAVRETGIDVFPVVLDVVKRAVDEDGESLSQTDGYGDDISENKRNLALALLSHVMERLDEFARSENYRGRLVLVFFF
ncbi:ARM repeat-containing protein, partial [Backusella circina FSU 941]